MVDLIQLSMRLKNRENISLGEKSNGRQDSARHGGWTKGGSFNNYNLLDWFWGRGSSSVAVARCSSACVITARERHAAEGTAEGEKGDLYGEDKEWESGPSMADYESGKCIIFYFLVRS